MRPTPCKAKVASKDALSIGLQAHALEIQVRERARVAGLVGSGWFFEAPTPSSHPQAEG